MLALAMTAPKSEAELMARARELAGRSLGELAGRLGLAAPPDLRRAKGFAGQLVERLLGASAGSRATPDFEALGVELKTLPVDARGRPLESTFVTTIELREIGEQEWERSRVRAKLARVLWVPLEGERRIPVGDRRLGEPVIWSPSAEEEADLRFDWEELAGLIGTGDVDRITGHLGRFLQVRPKAAHSRVRRRGIDEDGALIDAMPKGFYLRTAFTARILRRHFALPATS